MALTLTLQQVSQPAIADAPVVLIVNITNTSSAAVTLNSVQVSESTESDCQIQQPYFLQTNMPVGLGNPVIVPAGTVSYPFPVIFPSPLTAGPSPNQPAAPGFGPAGMQAAFPADSNFILLAQAAASDGSVGSISLAVSVLTATAPFPRPEGGALQFSQGTNLINGIIMGVL